MTYESVLKYTEESVKQCRELASFLKKRQAAEAEYAKALLKIAQKAPPISNLSPSFYRSPSSSTVNVSILSNDKPDNNFRSQLLKTSLWKNYCDVVEETQKLAESHNEMALTLQQNVIDPFQNYIREMEAIRKLQLEKGQEFIKNLQDAYAGLRKVKKEYESLQTVSNEAVGNHLKAQQNPGTRDREMEKVEKQFHTLISDLEQLTIKMQTAIEKARRAEETLQICEDICNNAKEDYFGTFLPGLYELEKAQSRNCAATFEGLSERVSDIDISEDSDDFIVHEEAGTTIDVPVKNISNPIHAGVIQVKRGDLVGTWKEMYAVFAGDKCLYLYVNRDSNRPLHVISMRDATVSSIDDSFFGKSNCIQLAQSTNSGRQIYNIFTPSENDRDKWLQNLRDFCFCCPKCASVYGYSNETFSNLHLLDRVNGYRLIRSLHLSIMEAKELPAPPGSRLINPYCMVLFDDVKQAKTSIKSGESPFWGESFTFDDIRPHHNHVRVFVFYHNRIQRDVDIGYLTINLDQVKSPKRVEEWCSIRPTMKSLEEMGSIGSLRIAFTFREEHLLPTSQYDAFLSMVTEPKFTALLQLGKLVVTDREALGKTVVRVLIGLGREVEGLQVLLESDIQATEDPNIIFRGNSLATKAFDQYMKQIGMPYLHATIGHHLRTIASLTESCEVDPLRVDNPEKERINVARLSQYASLIWNSILKSVDQCPRQFCQIFAFIRRCIDERWGSGLNAKYSGVSGFLFLRFFCPAILSPRLFNITQDLPTPAATRTLTLLAKIIQNLANLTEFGNKEPYMVQFNVFIQSQMPSMRAFIDRLSTDYAQNPQISDVRIDVRRETEALYQLFSQYLGDIITSSTGSPVDELVNIMKELQLAHKRYDGDERQISEAVRALGGSTGGSAVNSPRRPNLPPIPQPKISTDISSGPSSPPSSVFASPIVSAHPPKIELMLDEANAAAAASISPPLGLSPAASPMTYRKHREVSIYGRVTNKSTSFENLEQLLNSIATGGDAASIAAKLRETQTRGEEIEASPASGTTSPKYTDYVHGSPKSNWSSSESLPDTFSEPQQKYGINPVLGFISLNGRNAKPPPRGSSSVEKPQVSSTHVRPDGIVTTLSGQSTFTPSQSRGYSSHSSASSSPVDRGSPATSVHSLPSDGSHENDDSADPAGGDAGSTATSPQYGSVVSGAYTGPGGDEDGFSDRSSVKSMESYKSDKNFEGAGVGRALRATAARIKHRLSMLVQGSNNAPASGSGSGGGPLAAVSKSRRRAPSPMLEEKEHPM
ncbi:hypothetical protein BC829DRAFT_485678 [Chytridium lagenaria]|nr:hypothetical protein BC829DRAFT_485678 [Chytridium lagenaria]